MYQLMYELEMETFGANKELWWERGKKSIQDNLSVDTYLFQIQLVSSGFSRSCTTIKL